jgi:hypothetical protein
VKSKAERERPQNKKLYNTLEGKRARSEQAGEINVLKISKNLMIQLIPINLMLCIPMQERH